MPAELAESAALTNVFNARDFHTRAALVHANSTFSIRCGIGKISRNLVD